jgi:hypothetical protein
VDPGASTRSRSWLQPERIALRHTALVLFVCFVCFVVTSALLRADPLSKSLAVDFFRDVPSRNLKGLATRSDGRLVPGPVLRELTGPVPAELLWCLERGASPDAVVRRHGPRRADLEVTIDLAAGSYTTRPVVKLDDAQVFAVRRLPDGALLAGTSPKGMLYLVRDGQPVARVVLPVDSIFDILLLPEGKRNPNSKRQTTNPEPKTRNPKPKTRLPWSRRATPAASIASISRNSPPRV